MSTAGRGFPADTPLDRMTPEQQSAYWRHQARKHERRAARWDDAAAVRARHEELNPAPKENTMSPEQEAIEQAENAAWERTIQQRTSQRRADLAVEIAAATGRRGADLDVIVNRLDPDTFMGPDDEIDTDAVASFAALLSRTQ